MIAPTKIKTVVEEPIITEEPIIAEEPITATLVVASKLVGICPCDWSITMVDGVVKGYNTVTQETFTGSPAEFNAALRG